MMAVRSGCVCVGVLMSMPICPRVYWCTLIGSLTTAKVDRAEAHVYVPAAFGSLTGWSGPPSNNRTKPINAGELAHGMVGRNAEHRTVVSHRLDGGDHVAIHRLTASFLYMRQSVER